MIKWLDEVETPIFFLPLLTLTFLLDRPGFEVQHSATVLRLRRAELLPHLLGIVRMNLRVEAGAEPVALSIVQYRRDRVGHVDNSARLAAYDEQETVRCFEDQVLQLLIREEGWLVGVVRGGISGACDTFHFALTTVRCDDEDNGIYRE